MERSHYIREFITGYKIGFAQGDSMKMLDDIKALKPTQIISVPLVWKRLYESIVEMFKSNSTGEFSLDDIDHNIVKKISFELGLENLRIAGTGSASLPKYINDFISKYFNVNFYEGYGMTECSGATITSLGQCESGIVGFPVSSSKIKLVDIDDLGYTNDDKPCSRGEIWIKASQGFESYINYPGELAEIIDPSGWIKTGDIGMWTENDNLKIIDRKKNIFKLNSGEFVRPDIVENVCKQCIYVGSIVISGDDRLRYPVALVFPNKNNVQNIKTEDASKLILENIQELLKSKNFKKLEIPSKIIILENDFSVENGLMTPSMKLKRNEVYKRFQHLFV